MVFLKSLLLRLLLLLSLPCLPRRSLLPWLWMPIRLVKQMLVYGRCLLISKIRIRFLVPTR
ncbi:hypothetical protein KC19_VG192700 [Ceratodon purpureus]|uniref:Uncharacterized protein n=1 Tax=Ceratodon purpureus TaxID=3225 RepID=A0A8T0HSS5_CERPU|nr:hypothetical protein KC19_VG192700 [Ceratodon purpureus]